MFLASKKKKIYVVKTTTYNSNNTFCELIGSIVTTITGLTNNLIDIQSLINGFQDSAKVKVDESDCAAYLSEKLASSDTIEVVIGAEVNGCKSISFKVKESGGGSGTSPLGNACETPWTAIESYGIIKGWHSNTSNPSIPNTQLQGSVKWRINKIGEIGLQGNVFAQNATFTFDSNKTNHTREIELFELPDIQCINDLLQNIPEDYYGPNINAKASTNPNGPTTNPLSRLETHLYRIGRKFYAKVLNASATTTLIYDFEFNVGQLKSIN